MNTPRIDKLQCRKYRLFWICWGAMAVWMIACIVNTIWLQENQTVLDTIGVGIMTFGILYILASLGNFTQKREMLTLWKGVHCKKYRIRLNRAFLNLFRAGTFVCIYLDMMIPKFLEDGETSYWRYELYYSFFMAFVAMLFSFATYKGVIISIRLYNFFLKFIYFTTIKYSGRIRRIGIDFILMLLALASLILFPAWLANTLVIISISSFLYDVYKIADFERQQEQMLCNCSRMKNLLLCMKKRILLRKLMINLGLFNG